MAGGVGFYVEGLTDLRSALRAADPKLTKELQKVNKETAIEVATDARTEYAAIYQQDTGRHAAAIKATATQTKAQVSLVDKGNSIGLLGQEFGGGYPQFPDHDNGGQFFYPSVREAIPRAEDRYLDALGEVAAMIAG